MKVIELELSYTTSEVVVVDSENPLTNEQAQQYVEGVGASECIKWVRSMSIDEADKAELVSAITSGQVKVIRSEVVDEY